MLSSKSRCCIFINRDYKRQSGWLTEEALQIAEERREVKSKRERERGTQLNAEFRE